jgi:heterodisulfide reductase subunit A
MAVAKANYLSPLHMEYIDVNKSALVVGGGLAGMTSALNLAGQGYKVYLVEKESNLGGNLKDLYYTIEGKDIQVFYKELMAKVFASHLIEIFTDSEIIEHSGTKGNFKTLIKTENDMKTIEHGVVILATGGREYKPSGYFYGENPFVITGREFEKKIDHIAAESAVLLP